MRIEVKVYVKKNDTLVFGPGTYKLLRLIDETGNISEACRRLKISYKKALRLISNVEKRLGVQIVETFKGGITRGGARLTDDGKKIVKMYGDVLRTVDRALREYIKERVQR
ncbi:MAG: LysR family transcriptional regulator [Euryarchaeota archaeon]|nr:LysR family transcriptional regulator [Euryarchaeota archaeon]